MALDKEKKDELRKQYGLKSTSTAEELLAAVLEEKERGKSVAPGSDETPNPEVKEQQDAEFDARFRPQLSEGGDDEQTSREDLAGEDGERRTAKTTVGDLDNAQPATAVAKHNSHGKKATVNGEEKFSDDAARVSPSLLSEMQSRLAGAEARLAAREKAETAARRDGYIRQWYKDGLISDDEAARVRARLDRDEELTVELISERVPAFATSELGHSEPSMFAASTDNTKTDFDLDDAVFGTKK